MNRARSARQRHADEAGYAVLMAVFLVASLLLFVAAATPSVLTEGRREREQDAVWRGKQYVRAIRLYYQGNGKLPQTLEDITKPNAVGVHYLRKAYADPVNHNDGKFRAIYVTPSGQLVGSVRYHTLQEMALVQGLGGAVGAAMGLPSSLFGQQAAPAQTGQGQTGQAQTGPPQTGLPGGAAPATGTTQPTGFGPTGQQPGSSSPFSSLQPVPAAPLEPVDGPVLGGMLIGVGSKIKQSSLLVYEGGKTYLQWEFIYNPLGAGAAAPGAAGIATGAPAGVVPGAGGTAPAVGQPGALGSGGLNPSSPVTPPVNPQDPSFGTPAAPAPSPNQ